MTIKNFISMGFNFLTFLWFTCFNSVGNCRFYTLMVLSTALFEKPAFRNLICNGLVLAEDGKKMSKRLKNYPSPMDVIDEYGAVSYQFIPLSQSFFSV